MQTDNDVPVAILHESVERFKECLELSWNYLFVELDSEADAGKIIDVVDGVMKHLHCQILKQYHLVDPVSEAACIVVKTADPMNLEEIGAHLLPMGNRDSMVCYLFDKS